MSFLDEVDELGRKVQKGNISIPVLVGIAALVLVVLFFALQQLVAGVSADSFSLESTASSAEETKTSESSGTVVVYISGAVVNPGVYELEKGSRINDAVVAAGGLTESASAEAINLAETVSDGQHISVASLSTGSSSNESSEISATSSTGIVNGKVNINTATLEELETLDGIGPSLAQKIIDDREANGAFQSITELTRVSGIGEKKYAAISNSITV